MQLFVYLVVYLVIGAAISRGRYDYYMGQDYSPEVTNMAEEALDQKEFIGYHAEMQRHAEKLQTLKKWDWFIICFWPLKVAKGLWEVFAPSSWQNRAA